MEAPTETVFAPAKLTVSLRITGVRDDGLHLIDAEMVTLDLVDELRIGPGAGLTIEGAGPDVDAGPDNLVNRALALAGREASVYLVKRIPSQAGLGGGSADAAAILRWAGFNDLEAASRLGADIAFCLVGGRARVRGIGEIVEPFDESPLALEIKTPAIEISTPAVYQQFRENFYTELSDEEFIRLSKMDSEMILQLYGIREANDLFEPALSLYPKLKEAYEHGWFFSGSGSSFFKMKDIDHG